MYGSLMDEFLESETLARLYLEQGHPGRALRIYEHLAAARPGSATLSDGITRCREEIARAAHGLVEG